MLKTEVSLRTLNNVNKTIVPLQTQTKRWRMLTHRSLSFSDALPEIVFGISRGFAEGTDCNLLKNETNFIKLLPLIEVLFRGLSNNCCLERLQTAVTAHLRSFTVIYQTNRLTEAFRREKCNEATVKRTNESFPSMWLICMHPQQIYISSEIGQL